MKKEIAITDPIAGTRFIGEDHEPFVIAEVSANHNGSLDKAMEIIEAAAAAGAHSVKFQTYTADTMTLDCRTTDFTITDEGSLWHGYTLHDLYKEAYTPWDWQKKMFDRARELGMIPLSTPFDDTSVDFLEEECSPGLYKIASFENADIPLIRKVAKTGKPVIMSTGMISKEDLIKSVQTLKENGCEDIILLKCTSAYPSTAAEANMISIPSMREEFDTQVGLSDHSLGLAVPLVAVAMGATVIEKHFIVDRNDKGPDSDFSIEPAELKELVIESKRAWQAIGEVKYGTSGREAGSIQFRRSLYVVKDLKAGEEFTAENVRSIRPGYGIEPAFYDDVIGSKATCDLKKGDALKHEHYQ